MPEKRVARKPGSTRANTINGYCLPTRSWLGTSTPTTPGIAAFAMWWRKYTGSGGSSSGSFVNARAGDPRGRIDLSSVPAVLHGVETNLPLRTLRSGASVRLVGGERLTLSGNVVMRVGALNADIGEVRVLVPLSEGVALYGYVRPGDLQPL